jgi:hypothetical protein
MGGLPMKKPKYKDFQLVISNNLWNIKFVTELKSDDGSSLMGLCDGDSLTISVDKNQKEELIPITIWHELTHAMLSDASYDEKALSEEYIAEAIGSRAFFITCQLPKWFIDLCKNNFNNTIGVLKKV